MTIKRLYSEARTLPNYSHTFITGNHEPRLTADKDFMRRGLLVETKNKFIEKKDYDKLPLNSRENVRRANKQIFRDLDNDEDKIAWIQLHLKHTVGMYAKAYLNLEKCKDRFDQYCFEIDPWIQLKIDRLEYSSNVNDEISKAALARLYNETYHSNVSDDTARNEGRRFELTYNKDRRMNCIRGTFTNVRITPLSRYDNQPIAAIQNE